MAMIDLAARGAEGPIALADIATRQDISISYLEQLFAKLRRGGIVRSVRGPGGGYMLAVPPEQLRVSEVALAVDDAVRPARCSPGMPKACANSANQCSSHALWEELGNQVYMFLNSITIQDVLSGKVLGTSGVIRAEDKAEDLAAAQ